MAFHTLENQDLIVKIEDFGAEVTSVQCKKSGQEYIWEGNPAYWNRHSPILFPFVGNQKGKKYSYKGKKYPMAQHGFARDMEFVLVEKEDEKAVFRLESSSVTEKNYPFQFVLEVTYILREKKLDVIWMVKNKGDNTMYFQIGAHPAFNTQAVMEEEESNYFIAFDGVKELKVRTIDMNTGLAKNETIGMPMNEVIEDKGYLRITESLFKNDALVIEDKQCTFVQLCKPDKTPYVTVSFDTPLFGVWSPAKKAVPFVCIEPWYGRCDKVDFRGDLEDKEYLNVLEANNIFNACYSIYFGC